SFPDELGLGFEYRYFVRNGDGSVIREGGKDRLFVLGDIEAPDMAELADNWRPVSDPDSLFATSAFSGVIFRRKAPYQPAPAISLKKGKAAAAGTVLRLQVVVPRLDQDHVLCVAGTIPALGDMELTRAVPMDGSGFPLWKLDIDTGEDGLSFEYIYVIKDSKGKVVLYEEGPSRIVPRECVKGCGARRLAVVTDNDFRYLTKWRGAGIAVPVFSLRTRGGLGVGEFPDLKLLADWASQCGFQLIQLLPVNDTSVTGTWHDSYPYADLSVFALHPLYLRIQSIAGAADLPKEMADELEAKKKAFDGYDHVNYEEVMALKMKLLRVIFTLEKTKFLASAEFKKFLKENAYWLEPYAAFCSLRDHYNTSDFRKWGRYSLITPESLREVVSPQSARYDTVALYYFIQYHLHMQLSDASAYAGKLGVVLKGDIPIGIHKRSDSCWLQPGFFNLDQSAGAPPDPFSYTGQNWGFPTYNWEAMARDGYSWWRKRLKQMSRYFQMVRLDHILGFFRIWEIPEEMVSGLMGHFNPAVPLWKKDLEKDGIWDFDRLCQPYIPAWLVRMIFGLDANKIIAEYMDEISHGHYRMKPQFNTQRKVEEHLALPENAAQADKERNEHVKEGLFGIIANVVLFKDSNKEGFHPRINMADVCSFDTLDEWERERLLYLYYDYFYHIQEDFWRKQAMVKLPVLKEASDMLICGEDLGMVPNCVPPVMQELAILGLRIQRMPKETDREFGYPYQYPYLTVCTTSSHDMSTIRGWWGEDYARTQRYYNAILGHSGDAPSAFTPAVCSQIIGQHLDSPSMWAVFPVQDILALSAELCRPGDPREEQINDPADPHHYWKFRLHIDLEKLVAQKEFNTRVLKMVKDSGRRDLY
ncbi:MAG: 4-alpha-glucanotransferase, partial [Candidatus Omnitrophica bacterium]|nr:4-alpha-glucanotransferase [Candidatus Omnitrophota bacterium]